MALPLAAKYTLAVLLLLSASPPACHAAQNITAVLAALPAFGDFSSLLTSAGLADDINQRTDGGPITVLAVNDTSRGMASLKTMPRDAIRSHLSLHVLLDCYYDDAELQRLPLNGTGPLVSTLFHAAGDAPGVYGMVRIGRFTNGKGVIFMPEAGAADGVAKSSFFVKSLYGAPYTMSVLQVYGVMAPITPDAARRYTNLPFA